MSDSRVYLLTNEKTSADSSVYLLVDKDGDSEASKMAATVFLHADGSVPGAVSEPQDFGSNGAKSDVINESTLDAGVTIDGTVIKDGLVSGVDVAAHAAGSAKTEHDGGVGDHTHGSAGAEGGLISYNVLTDKPTLLDTGREFLFMPEYAGAVLSADGTNNNGTMTAGSDDTQRMNYYNWTTSETTTQDYDIVLRFILPPEFSSFDVTDLNIYLWSLVDSDLGATGIQLVEFLDTAGVDALTASVKAQNTAWTEDANAFAGGTWTPGGIVTLRLRLFADNGENAKLGSIRIPWIAG